MDTPEVRKIGMGDVSDERMTESAAMIKETFDLPRTPKVEDVFGRSFLPPKADRMMPVLSN
jgi:NitT/TauT family transport system substrate-binding protein